MSPASGLETLKALTLRIEQDFPELDWESATLNEEGLNHFVVSLDDAWVFRFPRSGQRSDIPHEARILERCAPRLRVSVPRYEFLAHDYGGYRFLRGSNTASLASARRSMEPLLEDAGRFLTDLHSLKIAELPPVRSVDTPAEQSARYWCTWRPLLASSIEPADMAGVDEFFIQYARMPSGRPCFLHFDVKPEHLLAFDGRLSAVIDFSDCAIGDAACDFVGLWTLGEWAVRAALRGYTHTTGRDELLERSQMSFVAALVHRLAVTERCDGILQADCLAELKVQLTALA